LFIEPCLLSLAPGSRDREFRERSGLEFAHVLKGKVEFQFVGQKPVMCGEGDSILYRANLLHRLANPSDLSALVFLVNVPSA
jgi:quercetin dioxygenase-like cupin family protein